VLAGLNHVVAQLAETSWANEEIHPSWKPIVKVEVAANAASEMLELLALDGYEDAHLMPSFDSVIRELERRKKFSGIPNTILKMQPNDVG
jgi:hypothetical protein